MAASTDVAESLIKLAAGPSILGVTALLGYAYVILKDDQRSAGKGWLTLGAGLLVCGWMLVFLVLACPTVLRSWSRAARCTPCSSCCRQPGSPPSAC